MKGRMNELEKVRMSIKERKKIKERWNEKRMN